jgi:UDP-N-acetylglucosamine--N-acetylmuramyl-(pentapeptide) pyrophosphoryl-undecaprenol N-acetylglucosamine transferase
MKKNRTRYRFIFAGGGTGGHLYPAIAVAQQIRALKPEAEILFVGTKDKIEARVVPANGFDFKTIWISGFARKLNLKNMLFPVKVFVSAVQSLIINYRFQPRVAIGTGAYISGPVIWGASIMGARIMLLEQNSYPGVTNRLLEKKAEQIHLTFEDSKPYFRDQSKLHLSGNPVRIDLKLFDMAEAKAGFSLDSSKPVLLVVGGSLGAGSLNSAVAENIAKFNEKGIQIIWQTGQGYFETYKNLANPMTKIFPFIENMSNAFSACDLLLARSGATTIAEAANLGLPVVFVPSPNVAANHQYMNAKSLFDENAAELIEDKNLKKEIEEKISELIINEKKLINLKTKIKKFANANAAQLIASHAIKLAETI